MTILPLIVSWCCAPFRSRPLFSQMVGRGTRICDGKKDLLLLDFLFIHERHSLVRPASLIARTDDEAAAMTARSFERSESGHQDSLDLRDLATETQVAREKKLREELSEKGQAQIQVHRSRRIRAFAA